MASMASSPAASEKHQTNYQQHLHQHNMGNTMNATSSKAGGAQGATSSSCGSSSTTSITSTSSCSPFLLKGAGHQHLQGGGQQMVMTSPPQESFLDHPFPVNLHGADFARDLTDLIEKSPFETVMLHLEPMRQLCRRPEEKLSQVEKKFKARALRELRYSSKHDQNLAHFAAVRKSGAQVGGSHMILKVLDELGVDVNKVDQFQQTPLFYAAREGNAEAVAYLIAEKGAQANQVDKNHQTALFYAAKSDSHQTGTKEEFLVKAHKEGAMRASTKGSQQKTKARMEIKKTIDFNKRNHKQNRMMTVRLLIEGGADPSLEDVNKRKAVQYALDQDMTKYIQSMMQGGGSDGGSSAMNSQSQQLLKRTASASSSSSKRAAGGGAGGAGAGRSSHFFEQSPAYIEVKAIMEEQEKLHQTVLFISEPSDYYEGQYMVHYSKAEDGEALAELETEFIHDHKSLIQELHNGEEPPWVTVCKSVGLNPDKAQRQNIIKNIAGRRDKHACTLKVSHFLPCPIRPPAGHQGRVGDDAHIPANCKFQADGSSFLLNAEKIAPLLKQAQSAGGGASGSTVPGGSMSITAATSASLGGGAAPGTGAVASNKRRAGSSMQLSTQEQEQQNLQQIYPHRVYPGPCIKWLRFDTVGYLYQKVKVVNGSGQKLVTSGSGSSFVGDQAPSDPAVYEDKENCPTVEISHLKVSREHKQRSVAVMLYCGLIQHLKNSSLVPCIADMRLSVFAQNRFATRLYTKLGFAMDGEEWSSDLQGWAPGQVSTKSSSDHLLDKDSCSSLALKKTKEKDMDDILDEGRSIAWRRYRRLEAGVVVSELLARYKSLIRYRWSLGAGSGAGSSGSASHLHGNHGPHAGLAAANNVESPTQQATCSTQASTTAAVESKRRKIARQ